MNTTTILLTDGTIGKITEKFYRKIDAGDMVEVTLHDENGMMIKKTGEVEEILEG